MRGTPKAFGSLVGILAAYFVSEGMYQMMLIGSCSTPAGPGEVPCPPGTGKYFAYIFVGILVGMFSIFVGGSWLSFSALFVGIAVGAIRAGLAPAGEGTAGGQGWFFFFGLCFLIGPAIMLIAVPLAGLKKMKAARLMSQGSQGVGTVLAIDDTGITINNNPRVKIAMRIEPTDGVTPPFEATKTTTVSRVHLPRVGDRYDVWFDPNDRSDWMFVIGTPGGAPGMQPGLRKIVEMARVGAQPVAPAPQQSLAVVGELNRLNELRLTGKISAEEFAARTADLLRSTPG